MSGFPMPIVSDQIVIGLGEVLWDVFPDGRRPGGAPANVAFHANQLGRRGIVVSRVGLDPLGDELCAHLSEKGLELSGIERDETHPTGRVTVDLSDSSHPDFTIHENAAWDFLEADEPRLALTRRAAAVCCGTLAQRSQQSREAIHALLDVAPPECLIVYDVNLRQRWYEAEWIERTLRSSDVVKLNQDELQVLADLLDLPSDPSAFAAGIRTRYGVGLTCITRAEHGCLLIDEQHVLDVPGESVQVADAVGAGDAFTAALIVTRLDAWPLETAAAFANKVGGLVASRPGAMPELADELNELRNSFN